MPRERLDDEIEGDVPPPSEIDAMVSRMNDEYFVVNQSGKVLVYRRYLNLQEGRWKYDKMRFDDFRKLLQNKRMRDVDQDVKCVADIWLTHPNRKQYAGGVVFEPEKKVPNDQLNLWEGFSVKPAKGSWDKLLWHIENIVCDGDQTAFEYALKWMAYFAQYPGRQGEVAFVMRGKEGTGKGILGRALMHIARQHAVQISDAKHLTGNFNAHLFNCILVFADEAFFAGNPQHIGALKRLITEPTLFIEAKYEIPFSTPNYTHLVMASNEEWVVPASLEARRFFVTNVSDKKRGDFAYFKDIYEELENGGYEAMLHDLLAYDLSKFDIRDVPQTAGLKRQQEFSLDHEHAWFLEVLERGYVFESKLGLTEFRKWDSVVSTELLFSSYKAFCKEKNFRNVMARPAFGRFLTQMKALSRKASLIVGEAAGPDREAFQIRERRPGYFLGLLPDARRNFNTITGLDIEWSDDASDDAADGSILPFRERRRSQ